MRQMRLLHLILAAILIFGFAPRNHLQANDSEGMVCGNNFIHREVMGELPPEGLRLRFDTVERGDRLTSVTLNAGANLLANAEALAAFNRAIDVWISWFDDPVSIVIDADLQPLGGTAIGAASSKIFQDDYSVLRGQMVSDADGDEAICASLPTLAQFNVITPIGYDFIDQMTATKANFSALGYDMSFDPDPDVSIEFNSDKLGDFDFDRSDGLDSDKLDFEGVVLHEIGHALGFGSRITSTDYWIYNSIAADVKPRPLDLFRLEPGQGAADFTNADRVQVPANHTGDPSVPVQMTYDGTDDFMMSTGYYYGDGRQNSHWKDNSITTTYLGLMDPTLADGQQVKPLRNDIRALGLAGWDVGQGPCLGIPLGDCNGDYTVLTTSDLVQMQRYLQRTASHFGNLCSYELNHYDNPFFPCEPTFGDLLFYLLYFAGTLTIGDLNPECKYTIFPERYGLNILIPGDVDLSSSFSETYTIQLENVNVIPIYIWSLTVPVHFPYTGGTGSASYSITNIQDYGVWSTISPINTSGEPAFSYIGSQPLMVPALTTIDLFDVEYDWTYTSGSPVMNAEFFMESPGCVPVASISTTPAPPADRAEPTWLFEVKLGSELVSHQVCDCIPGEADGIPPINILDIVYVINYVYKNGPDPVPYALCSADADGECTVNILDIVYIINYIYKNGPAPVDCPQWLINCGPPLRK